MFKDFKNALAKFMKWIFLHNFSIHKMLNQDWDDFGNFTILVIYLGAARFFWRAGYKMKLFVIAV